MITAVLSNPDHNRKLVLLSIEPNDLPELAQGEALHVLLDDFGIDAELVVIDGGKEALNDWLQNNTGV